MTVQFGAVQQLLSKSKQTVETEIRRIYGENVHMTFSPVRQDEKAYSSWVLTDADIPAFFRTLDTEIKPDAGDTRESFGEKLEEACSRGVFFLTAVVMYMQGELDSPYREAAAVIKKNDPQQKADALEHFQMMLADYCKNSKALAVRNLDKKA